MEPPYIHYSLILDLQLIHLSYSKLLTQIHRLLLPEHFLNKYKINKQMYINIVYIIIIIFIHCSSSPSSTLTLEKSNSSPVPFLYILITSKQVVSKCVVASYDSDTNIWL